MTDLDTILRDGLSAATADLGDVEPDELARRLATRRRPRPRRAPMLAAAAIVVAVGLVAATLWWRDRGDRIEVVDDRPASEPGFAGFGPGWHRLDTGPVPPMSSVSVAWAADRLVVSGTVLEPDGSGSARVYGFDPVVRTWNRLPDPPMDSATIVDADGVLVAVGVPDYRTFGRGVDMRWATLVPGAGAWDLRGDVPVAPELVVTGGTGPTTVNGSPYLLWTGERVVDLTHLAALDPVTGEAASIPLSVGDPVGYMHLLSAAPAWTGEEVLLSAWARGPGLAWSADGSRVREVPGLPQSLAGGPVVRGSTAVRIGNRVLLVAHSADDAFDAPTAWYDPATDAWSHGPTLPVALRYRCGVEIAAAGKTVLVQPCDYASGTPDAGGMIFGPPQALRGDEWVEVERPPTTPGCCLGLWFSTPTAVVMWSTDTDTANDPDAPYVEAAVWVPDRDG